MDLTRGDVVVFQEGDSEGRGIVKHQENKTILLVTGAVITESQVTKVIDNVSRDDFLKEEEEKKKKTKNRKVEPGEMENKNESSSVTKRWN